MPQAMENAHHNDLVNLQSHQKIVTLTRLYRVYGLIPLRYVIIYTVISQNKGICFSTADCQTVIHHWTIEMGYSVTANIL
jgi:hypothetical protein